MGLEARKEALANALEQRRAEIEMHRCSGTASAREGAWAAVAAATVEWEAWQRAHAHPLVAHMGVAEAGWGQGGRRRRPGARRVCGRTRRPGMAMQGRHNGRPTPSPSLAALSRRDGLRCELKLLKEDLHRMTLELSERSMRAEKLASKYELLSQKARPPAWTPRGAHDEEEGRPVAARGPPHT